MLILTIVTKREKWYGRDNIDTYDISDMVDSSPKTYKRSVASILCDLDTLDDMDFSCITREAYLMDTSDLSVKLVATAKTDDSDEWYWDDNSDIPGFSDITPMLDNLRIR